MSPRELTRSMLPVALVILLAACGGTNAGVSPTNPGSSTGPTTTPSSNSVSSTTTIATDSTTTAPDASSTPDPCGIFTRAELEELVGFTLSTGLLSDLTSHGINGLSCFFQAESTDTANVSVTIVTGSQAAVLYKYDLPEERGWDLSCVDCQAYIALGDIQDNVHILVGDVLLTLDVIWGRLPAGLTDFYLHNFLAIAIPRLG